VDVSAITYVQGDTSQTPDQGFTAGSKSIQVQGPLVRRAAATAFQALSGLASAYLGVPESQIVAQDGSIGIGPTIADAARFNSARQFAAWIGLVPRQHSSGGRERMGGLSKREDGYLRRLLVHGASCHSMATPGECASPAMARRRAARTQTCKRRRCGARQQKCPHRLEAQKSRLLLAGRLGFPRL
jgi:hypothetical protein